MSFGRWLLIHSFSIFIVVVFVLGYFYREELQLEQVYQQVLNRPVDQQASVPQKSPEPVQDANKIDVAENQVTDVAPATTTVAEPSTRPELVFPAQHKPPVDREAPRDKISAQPTVSSTFIEQSELLYQARKAYWDKNYEMAIFHYQQLIEEDGDNPDYIGELGNIYYSLNDFDNAAQQFYQAAVILIARDQREQASLLVSPVIAMNRDLGERLKQRLRQAR
jgi:tetratricopeptide (TPR) repeat protein